MRRKIICVIGTRPEGVKMAPVILALQREPWVELKVVSTGQHREMLNQVLDFFGIAVDEDLDIMRPNQSLAELTAASMTALDAAFERHKPDVVVAQGDTTSVAVAALAAFYRRIPFAHVEAGLRTFDLHNPFPEELNRVIAGRIASLHFAPTVRAANALRDENVRDSDIVITGNTVIDALLEAIRRDPQPPFTLPAGHRIVLVTQHRRESFGPAIEDVCWAVRDLVDRFPDLYVVWPVHLNPNVNDPIRRIMTSYPRVHLCEPLAYNHFVAVMSRAHLMLTDSGGVQEEAPALSKPVLVLRDVTERPEAVEEGVVVVVGTKRERIVSIASTLLSDAEAYRKMARGVSPYGDGKAAERIVQALRARFNVAAGDIRGAPAERTSRADVKEANIQ